MSSTAAQASQATDRLQKSNQFPAMETYRTARAGYALTFYWHGGPYVDVHINGRAAHALNVWDYSTSKPRVPYSGAGLKSVAVEWLSGTYGEELAQYAQQ